MMIYSFHPHSLINIIIQKGFALVDFKKTNLYEHMFSWGGYNASQYYEAYLWMSRKLEEKAGIWLKDLYDIDLNIPKDEAGDYIDDKGLKLPVLPFWGWFLTDGKNKKPDAGYSFGTGAGFIAWNRVPDVRLVTLDIPERFVLLSDANAWYCVLEGRPCFEYESREGEKKLLDSYHKRIKRIAESKRRSEAIQKEADELRNETLNSWDNIFRLKGRRLRTFMGIRERHDVQAAFPMIVKDWIVWVEEMPNG